MWARIMTLLLGVWLMVAPDLFNFGKTISTNGHIIGPLLVTFSIIAMSESTRNVRMLNLPLGAWLLFAPWMFAYDTPAALISDYTVGVLTLILSLVKLKRTKEFGGGWSSLWKV
jgi:hypothetical protein